MKLFFSILLALASVMFSYGQINLENFAGGGAVGNTFTTLRKKKDIGNGLPTVGSYYINDKFLPCQVFYNNERLGNFYYRHNAFNDEIELKDTNLEGAEVSSLATLKELSLINIVTKEKLALHTFKDKKEVVRNGYLYTLTEGSDYKLYFKNTIKFKEGVKAVNSLVRSTPNRFSQFPEYYFKSSDDKFANFIDGNKKELLGLLNEEDRNKASSFIKENKIRLKKTEDLIKLFDYLNAAP